MILIGEKLNSSIPKTMEAFSAHDEAAVIGLIQAAGGRGRGISRRQHGDLRRGGARGDALGGRAHPGALLLRHHDRHGGPGGDGQAVQAAAGTPLILNSATLTDRFDEVTALAHSSGASVVGLPIDGEMPHTLEEKCEKLAALVEKLRKAGLPDRAHLCGRAHRDAGHRRRECEERGGRGPVHGAELPGRQDDPAGFQTSRSACPGVPSSTAPSSRRR